MEQKLYKLLMMKLQPITSSWSCTNFLLYRGTLFFVIGVVV